MDLFTVVVAAAAKYGIKVLVKAAGASDDVAAAGAEGGASLAADLLSQLRESEARVTDRLRDIDEKLDQVLEQRFSVSQANGLRYLTDSGTGSNRSRRQDLERARECFIDAESAARSNLQIATSKRYLLLTYLYQNRRDRATRLVLDLRSSIAESAVDALLVLRGRDRRRTRAEVARRGRLRDEQREPDGFYLPPDWRTVGVWETEDAVGWGSFVRRGLKDVGGELVWGDPVDSPFERLGDVPTDLLSLAAAAGDRFRERNPLNRRARELSEEKRAKAVSAAWESLSLCARLMKEVLVVAPELSVDLEGPDITARDGGPARGVYVSRRNRTGDAVRVSAVTKLLLELK